MGRISGAAPRARGNSQILLLLLFLFVFDVRVGRHVSDFVRVPAANGRQLWFMHAAENARGRSGGRGYPTRVENLVIINTGSLLGRNQTADRPKANESDARNARVTGGVIYEPFKNMPLSQFFVREIPGRIMEHRRR